MRAAARVYQHDGSKSTAATSNMHTSAAGTSKTYEYEQQYGCYQHDWDQQCVGEQRECEQQYG